MENPTGTLPLRSRPLAVPAFAWVFLFVTGCSADAGSSDAGAVDASTATDGAVTAPTADAATGDSAVPITLAPPTLTTLAKMAGGLHVMWKNGQKDCDSVEAERKGPADDFKVIFTVPGAADNKHDGVGLTAGTAYTYRLRCKKGDAYSGYSNVMTGTP
ncbi:MAG TPA: hypothetical protein PLR99_07910 [Polyangiaceae bacterium]|nr:hypothetical protein [Polyangiaceae bacterium]